MELAFAIAKGLLLALLGIEFKQYYAERKDQTMLIPVETQGLQEKLNNQQLTRKRKRMQTRSMAASTKITKFRQIGQRKCKMIYKASKRRISNKGEKTTGLAEPLADKDVYLQDKSTSMQQQKQFLSLPHID